jgi:hypothetical protein
MEDTDPPEDPFRTPGALEPEIVIGVGRPTIFLPIPLVGNVGWERKVVYTDRQV